MQMLQRYNFLNGECTEIFFKRKKNDAISSPCQLDCNQMQHGGRELNTTSLKNVLLLNVIEMKNGYSSRCKKKF